MSRTASRAPQGPIRFPRVSGDEPDGFESFRQSVEFSPRERG